jgi:hypothetical protein
VARWISVHPGVVNTGLITPLLDAGMIEEMADNMAVFHRMAKPEEIAVR